ncbi:MAG: FAD-dependent oxidoreductase [Chloroherpetonaceae bacterium]|nr:FAD-dependent oxidoreductase [Chthonomonadaceae bacterium]MDW8209244.1 FAD-dependent oxidoreductase [Chloroherpetonaceae bacterium]
MWRSLLLSFCLTAGTVARAQQTPPRSFEAIATSPSEIRLYWLPAPGAQGYRISRDNTLLVELHADAREYRDTGLEAGRDYRYQITALQDGRESPPATYLERTFLPLPVSGDGKTGTARYDVVVVQASSAGVAAAIEAGRRGMKVALIEPTTRLGGMPVNGLSATDLRRQQHISGFLVRFRDTVRALYAAEGVQTSGLQYEPRIAHQAMKSLLFATPNVDVYRRARLSKVHTRHTGALSGGKPRRRVTAIDVEELDATGAPTGRRARLSASIFIDATDSGDLAAWAGAPYRIGREPRSPDEPHNGVIYYDRAGDRLLPGSTGKGDRRIQSYAYLITVKDYGPDADRTVPRPPNYDRNHYIHTPPWERSWAVTSGKLPNDKYEINQHPQGSDLQEINYRYPEGDYRERARVEQRYREHVLGYLHYIQTEQGQKQLGLPDDEYRDSGGFPPLLYVREGRRIVGEQLPTEREIIEARRITRPESIGIGDYPMDSHAVRVKTDWSSPDMGEGEWWLYLYTPWYPIPFGVMVPQQLDNVFVTIAVSSTHVSYGTYRMEPVRMQFGQAAGIAAALAVRYGLRARDVPVRQVQDELLPWHRNPLGDPGIVLHFFPDVNRNTRNYNVIQYMAARGFIPEGERFEPEAPTTRAEAARWLRLLAERGAPLPERTRSGVRRAYYPYAGHPTDRNAVPQWTENAPVTYSEFVVALARVLHLELKEQPAPANGPYADLPPGIVRAAAEALHARGIDTRLWEGRRAVRPDGKLNFRPFGQITHADMMLTLYIAQIGLGPLFFDPPADGKNGRDVPPLPFVND